MRDSGYQFIDNSVVLIKLDHPDSKRNLQHLTFNQPFKIGNMWFIV